MENEKSVFVSHSGLDSKLSLALVDAIEKCLPDLRQKVFDSSGVGIGVPAGNTIADDVRLVIKKCQRFFALLTPNAMVSPWVMVECGVAWSLDKRPIMLRVEGIEVPGPFRGINSIDLAARGADMQMYVLFEEMRDEMGLKSIEAKGLRDIKEFLELANMPSENSSVSVELSKQTAQLRTQVELDRLDRTFRFIERWEDRRLELAKDRARAALKTKKLIPVLEVEEDNELKKSVIYMFNYFEELYHAMSRDAVEPEVAVDALGGVIRNALKYYEPWLDQRHGSDPRYTIKLRRLLGTITPILDQLEAEAKL